MKKQVKEILELIFVKDAIHKAISILIAVIIWVIIYDKATIEKEFENIPIQFVTDFYNEVEEAHVYRTTLNIEGPEDILSTLKSEDIIASINLPKQLIYSSQYYINLAELLQVDLPDSCTIENISPKGIIVNIDIITNKIVPIKLQYQERNPNDPDKFIRIKEVNPANALLYGPSKKLEGIKEVKTSFISYKQIETNNGVVSADLLPSFEEIVKLSTNTTRLTFDLDYVLLEKVITKPVKFLLGSQQKLPDFNYKIKATLLSEEKYLKKLKEEDYEFFVIPEGKRKGEIFFWSRDSHISVKDIFPKKITLP